MKKEGYGINNSLKNQKKIIKTRGLIIVNRYCMILEIKEDKVPEYIRLHSSPPKEMLDALKQVGVKELLIWIYKNFSIIYYECEDINKVYDDTSHFEISKKRSEIMKDLFIRGIQYDDNGKIETCTKIYDLNQYLSGEFTSF